MRFSSVLRSSSAGIVLLILFGIAVLCIVPVVQSCGANNDRLALQSHPRVYADHLRCTYGAFTVDVPDDWTCSKYYKGGVEMYSNSGTDSSVMFIAPANTFRASEWNDDEWLSEVRKGNDGDVGQPVVCSKFLDKNAVIYFVEGRALKHKGMMRREGFIVSPNAYTWFTMMWPIEGKEGPTPLPRVLDREWRSVAFGVDPSRTYGDDDLVCWYGPLSLVIPDNWRCSDESSEDYIVASYKKSLKPTFLIVRRPKAIPKGVHTDEDWIKLSKGLPGKKANPSPNPKSKMNGFVAYFNEAPFKSKHLQGAIRRGGYLVGKSECARFVEVWPDAKGEALAAVNDERAKVWRGMTFR